MPHDDHVNRTGTQDTNSTECLALSLNNPRAKPLLCPTQDEVCVCE